jgi:hypothetical protein
VKREIRRRNGKGEVPTQVGDGRGGVHSDARRVKGRSRGVVDRSAEGGCQAVSGLRRSRGRGEGKGGDGVVFDARVGVGLSEEGGRGGEDGKFGSKGKRNVGG